jgi:soluble lytic murein transglycosylase
MRKYKTISNQPSTLKRKQKSNNKALIRIAGLGIGLLITSFVGFKTINWLGQTWNKQAEKIGGEAVIPLIEMSPSERQTQLEKLTKDSQKLNSNRARYLLAADLLEQKQPEKALEQLKDLEKKYPVLAANILQKRAQAYQILGDKEKAQKSWQELIKNHPQSPIAAEAMFTLGKEDPNIEEKAIEQFPSHPLSLAAIREQLQKNPQNPELLLHIVKYAGDKPSVIAIQDQLLKNYAPQLKTPEWQIIANNYWQHRQYNQASVAYRKAPNTPLNAYRVGKSLELNNKKAEAIQEYKYLIAEFPNTPESDLGLIALGKLSPAEDTIPYLDEIISKYPRQAAEALSVKTKILEQKQNDQAVTETAELLLNKYSKSEGSAEYRWHMALKENASKNYAAALKWASAIITENPQSKFAPRANFWAGKWAKQLGKNDQAKTYFEGAIAKYPQSYYAWRSAVYLGWKVGDFTTISDLNPPVAYPHQRPKLTAGSDAVKELYQIGQDQDASTLWAAEFTNKSQATVAEQFTDGLIKLASGKYLQAIDKIAKLEDRETAQEQAEYKALKQQTAYWYALYPFPYLDLIENSSKTNKINPLLVTALIRQESRFETDVKSVVGATGLMQLMPTTAAWVAKQINLTNYQLEKPTDNISLGTKFLKHSHETYKNNSLLAVASYNAGSGNVGKWLTEKGYNDPDEFVENIPFDETNWYVKNVFGNYWNYLRLYNTEISEQVAKIAPDQPLAVNQ